MQHWWIFMSWSFFTAAAALSLVFFVEVIKGGVIHNSAYVLETPGINALSFMVKTTPLYCLWMMIGSIFHNDFYANLKTYKIYSKFFDQNKPRVKIDRVYLLIIGCNDIAFFEGVLSIHPTCYIPYIWHPHKVPRGLFLWSIKLSLMIGSYWSRRHHLLLVTRSMQLQYKVLLSRLPHPIAQYNISIYGVTKRVRLYSLFIDLWCNETSFIRSYFKERWRKRHDGASHAQFDAHI